MLKIITRQILPGASIGFLVGLLVGLSTSQVVGSILAGLTALLAAFFGLSGSSQLSKSDEFKQTDYAGQAARIASFGIICAAAVIFGIYLRTHNLLGSSPSELVKQWEAVGLSTEQARNVAIYQQVGILPQGLSADDKGRLAGAMATVLFGAASTSDCEPLSAARKTDPVDRLRAFRNTGGEWEKVADTIEGLTTDKQSRIMEATWQLVCKKR
jgi:hypothetical protein